MTISQSKLIEVPGQHDAAMLRLFAIFWNVVSWPLAALFIFGSPRFSPWLLLIALFPLGGLFLGMKAWKSWQAQQRIGRPALQLRAASLGQKLEGVVRFAPPFASRLGAAQQAHEVSVQVQYMLDASLGEDTHVSAAWQGEPVRAQLVRGAQQLEFAADLPAQLPPTTEGEFNLTYWQVVLKALDCEVKFKLPPQAIDAAPPVTSVQ